AEAPLDVVEHVDPALPGIGQDRVAAILHGDVAGRGIAAGIGQELELGDEAAADGGEEAARLALGGRHQDAGRAALAGGVVDAVVETLGEEGAAVRLLLPAADLPALVAREAALPVDPEAEGVPGPGAELQAAGDGLP